jgi:hypothetical protein
VVEVLRCSKVGRQQHRMDRMLSKQGGSFPTTSRVPGSLLVEEPYCTACRTALGGGSA